LVFENHLDHVIVFDLPFNNIEIMSENLLTDHYSCSNVLEMLEHAMTTVEDGFAIDLVIWNQLRTNCFQVELMVNRNLKNLQEMNKEAITTFFNRHGIQKRFEPISMAIGAAFL